MSVESKEVVPLSSTSLLRLKNWILKEDLEAVRQCLMEHPGCLTHQEPENASSDTGSELLYHAISRVRQSSGHDSSCHDLSIIKLLLEHGALSDTNKQGAFQGTDDCSLTWAVVSNQASLVDLLIENGSVVDAKVQGFMTALMRAAESNHPNSARSLIKAGADLDIQEHIDGLSALMFAALSGHLEMVVLLVNAGANTQLKGKYGDDALSIAIGNGHQEVADYLSGFKLATQEKKELQKAVIQAEKPEPGLDPDKARMDLQERPSKRL